MFNDDVFDQAALNEKLAELKYMSESQAKLLLEDAAEDVKNYLESFDWEEEKNVEEEVEEILTEVIKGPDISEVVKTELHKRMQDAMGKFMLLIAKQKVKELAGTNNSAPSGFDASADLHEARDTFNPNASTAPHGPASHSPPQHSRQRTTPATPGHADQLMIQMLQKKAAQLRKQIEMADQKARSATHQWQNDKGRYKELLDKSRADQDELMRRLQIAERKARHLEQMERDPNMLDTQKEARQLETVKEVLLVVETELKEKKHAISQLTGELTETKGELTTAVSKIDVLGKRIDELIRVEDKLNDHVEMLEKEEATANRRIYALEQEISTMAGTLEEEKQNTANYRDKAKMIEAQLEDRMASSKSKIEELRKFVEQMIEQKDAMTREHAMKMDNLQCENSKLTLEKEQIARDYKHLSGAMLRLSKEMQHLLEQFENHDATVTQKLERDLRSTDYLKGEVRRLSQFVESVASEAEAKVATAKQQAAQLNSTLSHDNIVLKAENHTLKDKLEADQEKHLQFLQEVTKERLVFQQEVDRRQAEINKLHEDLVTEKNSPKGMTQDQIDTILEQEKLKWQEKISDMRQQSEGILNDLHEARARLKDLQAEHRTLQEQIQGNDDKLVKLRQGWDRDCMVNEDNRPRFSKLSAMHQTEKENANKLWVQVGGLTQETIMLHEQVVTLEQEIVSQQEKISKLELKVQAEKEEQQRLVEEYETKLLTVASSQESVYVEKKAAPKPKMTNAFIQTDPIKVERDRRTKDPDVIPGEEILIGRIEELIKEALVTSNLYFSKDTDSFTNTYPLDEDFQKDLIKGFFGLAQGIRELNKHTRAREVENLVFHVAKDLIIKLDKAREESVQKLKAEHSDLVAERIEETAATFKRDKDAALYEQREGFERELALIKEKTEKEIKRMDGRLSDQREQHRKEMIRMREEWEKELDEMEDSDEYGYNLADYDSDNDKSTTKNKDIDSDEDSVDNGDIFDPATGLTRHQSTLKVKSPKNDSEDRPDVAKDLIVDIPDSGANKPARPPRRNSVMRGNSLRGTRRSQEMNIDILKAQLRSELEDTIRTEMRAEWEKEQSRKDQIHREMVMREMGLEGNVEKQLEELWKELPERFQGMTMEAMQEELLSGSLAHIGDVSNENFNRLRNKGFGTDDIIQLTIIEHHMRYDSGSDDATEQQQRQNRMQLKSMEIQRNMLLQRIVKSNAILDLLAFHHATDVHYNMLNSLNAWRSLMYYGAGGVFKDVLIVHLDVLSMCIRASGGIPAARGALSFLSPDTDTKQWPEHFRVHALESFRAILLAETKQHKKAMTQALKFLQDKNITSMLDTSSKPQNMQQAMDSSQQDILQRVAAANVTPTHEQHKNVVLQMQKSVRALHVLLPEDDDSTIASYSSQNTLNSNANLVPQQQPIQSIQRGASKVSFSANVDANGVPSPLREQDGAFFDAASGMMIASPGAAGSPMKKRAKSMAEGMDSIDEGIAFNDDDIDNDEFEEHMAQDGSVNRTPSSAGEMPPKGPKKSLKLEPRNLQTISDLTSKLDSTTGVKVMTVGGLGTTSSIGGKAALLRRSMVTHDPRFKSVADAIVHKSEKEEMSDKLPANFDSLTFSSKKKLAKNDRILNNGQMVLKNVEEQQKAKSPTKFKASAHLAMLAFNTHFRYGHLNDDDGDSSMPRSIQYASSGDEGDHGLGGGFDKSVARQQLQQQQQRQLMALSMHAPVDKLVFRALKGQKDAVDSLHFMHHAFQLWEDGQNIAANTTLQGSLVADEVASEVVPMLMRHTLQDNEVPDKIKEIRDKVRHSVEILSLLARGAQLPNGQGLSYTPSHAHASKVGEHPITKTSETQHRHDQDDDVVVTIAAKPHAFDCATQTPTGKETAAPSAAVTKARASRRKSERASTVAAESSVHSELETLNEGAKPRRGLPRGFLLAHFRDDEFEVAPGLFMLTHTTVQNLLIVQNNNELNPNKTVDEMVKVILNLPNNVFYCRGMTNTLRDSLKEKLLEASIYMDLPQLMNCRPFVFPAVFSVQQGVNLVCGYQYVGQGNEYIFSHLKADRGKDSTEEILTLPHDVLLFQLADDLPLPFGIYPVQLSPRIMLPLEDEVNATATEAMQKMNVPIGHELVQMLNCSVDFPVGLEVAPGVRMASTPVDMVLPEVIRLVRKEPNVMLPDFMVTVKRVEVDEELNVSPLLRESCMIRARPVGVSLDLGIEVMYRPPGFAMPPGMRLVPLRDYPTGLTLPPYHELVQLEPKFDLPDGAKLTAAWYFCPRPNGLHLQSNQFLVYPEPLLADHAVPPLPMFACVLPMPVLPQGMHLPARCQLIELMLTRFTQFALPEGTQLGPGVTVLAPKIHSSNGHRTEMKRPAVNAVVIKRAPTAVLPPGVHRGSRSDLPSGIRLEENMEVVRLSVRFELPRGVKIDGGVTLGPCVQLHPGTLLKSAVINLGRRAAKPLTVMEWPHGVTLPQGTELVKEPPAGEGLPFEFQLIQPPVGVTLPKGTSLVRLPHKVFLESSLEVANGITFGVESVMDEYHRSLPEGMVFVSRQSPKAPWPPELQPVHHNSLPHKLARLLEEKARNMGGHHNKADEQRQVSSGSGGGKGRHNMRIKLNINIEVARITAHIDFPAGVELIPGVKTLTRPLWTQPMHNVVLVQLPGPDPAYRQQLIDSGICEVPMRSELEGIENNFSVHHSTAGVGAFMFGNVNTSAAAGRRTISAGGPRSAGSAGSAGDGYNSRDWAIPENAIFVQLPNVLEVHSWGSALPGVEPVNNREAVSNVALPPHHFLIERPRHKVHEELPPGFQLGISEQYRNIRFPQLPPQIEIMHLVAERYLPRGVNLINTSTLRKNAFNNLAGMTYMGIDGVTYTKRTFEPRWIPRLAPFEPVSSKAVIIAWPQIAGRADNTIDLFRDANTLLYIKSNKHNQRGGSAGVKRKIRTLFDSIDESTAYNEENHANDDDIHYPTNIVRHRGTDTFVPLLLGKNEQHLVKHDSFMLTSTPQDLLVFADDVDESSSRGKNGGIIELVEVSNGFPSPLDRLKHPNRISLLGVGMRLGASHEDSLVVHPKLTRTKRQQFLDPQIELNKFLATVNAFRFGRSNQEAQRELEHLKFDLHRDSLWKALQGIDLLKQGAMELNNQLEASKAENVAMRDQITLLVQQYQDLAVKIQTEEDYRAIIDRFKVIVVEREAEIIRLKAMTTDVQDRLQRQIDVLTTQIAQREDDREGLVRSRGSSRATTATVAITQANTAVGNLTDEQLELLKEHLQMEVERLSSTFNDTLLRILHGLEAEFKQHEESATHQQQLLSDRHKADIELSQQSASSSMLQSIVEEYDRSIGQVAATPGDAGTANSGRHSPDDTSTVASLSISLAGSSYGGGSATSAIRRSKVTTTSPPSPPAGRSGGSTTQHLGSALDNDSISVVTAEDPRQEAQQLPKDRRLNYRPRDLTKDSKGKPLAVSTAFPLDVRHLYHNQLQEGYMSISKSLSALPTTASVGGSLSLSQSSKSGKVTGGSMILGNAMIDSSSLNAGNSFKDHQQQFAAKTITSLLAKRRRRPLLPQLEGSKAQPRALSPSTVDGSINGGGLITGALDGSSSIFSGGDSVSFLSHPQQQQQLTHQRSVTIASDDFAILSAFSDTASNSSQSIRQWESWRQAATQLSVSAAVVSQDLATCVLGNIQRLLLGLVTANAQPRAAVATNSTKRSTVTFKDDHSVDNTTATSASLPPTQDALEQALATVADGVISLFHHCLSDQAKTLQRTIALAQVEHGGLVKDIHHLTRRIQLMAELYSEDSITANNSGNHAAEINTLRQRVWALEEQLLSVQDKEITPAIDHLKEKTDSLRSLQELEQQLKITSLAMRQLAAQEEQQLAAATAKMKGGGGGPSMNSPRRAEGSGAGGSHHRLLARGNNDSGYHAMSSPWSGNNFQISNNVASGTRDSTEVPSDEAAKAIRYRCLRLRIHAKTYVDRAEVVHKQVEGAAAAVIEHMEAYLRGAQQLLPPKIVPMLLRRSADYNERILKQKYAKHESSQRTDEAVNDDGKGVDERDDYDDGSVTSYVGNSGYTSHGGSTKKRLKPIIHAIGAMPVAPVQSHLTRVAVPKPGAALGKGFTPFAITTVMER